MAEKPQIGQSPYLHLDAGYTQAFDYDASHHVIYQGWAVPATANKASALWRIAKFTYSGDDVTDIQWAGGGEQFAWIWNNRAALSYS